MVGRTAVPFSPPEALAGTAFHDVEAVGEPNALANPADRDHCIQYMVAIPLIHGRLTADDYEDSIASDPRVDFLRDKMQVRENPQFTQDYFDPDKRYIGNAVQIFFTDGSQTEKVSIDFPIGHRKRRAEGIPVLIKKFEDALAGHLPDDRVEQILQVCGDPVRFEALPVNHLLDLFVV